MMLPRPDRPDTDPRRCPCAEHLRARAEQEATGSRDFGRGYMHAVRLLERDVKAA